VRAAIISDIHGNSWALKAVLSDIRNRGIETIINLGDSFYGPLDPAGTFELISANDMLSISGNEDRIIVNNRLSNSESRTMIYLKSVLPDPAVQWLAELPGSLVIRGDIFACHGVPGNDSAYLLEKPVNGLLSLRPDSEIYDLVRNTDQPVILCGHSHLQRIHRIGEKVIINPGSVGCPAFEDDTPVYHKSYSGDNLARYALLETGNHEIRTGLHAIPYDFESAAECALKNGFGDWAEWILHK
jgi:putative phosphoesterase